YRGVIQLRALAPLADGRSESVAESWLRLFWYEASLPAPELQWWERAARGTPIDRLDVALPGAGYGAEYDGEVFHTEPADQENDEDRRSWLDRERNWHLWGSVKADCFAFHADPKPRLQQGLVVARRRLAGSTAYPTLGRPRRPRNFGPTRIDGSAPQRGPELTGRRQVRGWRQRGGRGTRWSPRCRRRRRRGSRGGRCPRRAPGPRRGPSPHR